MEVMESFTNMNADISREMLRKNNKYCEVVGILISFQIVHGGFAEEGFQGGDTSQSSKGLDLWHWTRPWGKTWNRWLLQQQNKGSQNCHSMLNDDLLPPHVPKERQCYVNICLFIALLSDFLMLFHCRNDSGDGSLTVTIEHGNDVVIFKERLRIALSIMVMMC